MDLIFVILHLSSKSFMHPILLTKYLLNNKLLKLMFAGFSAPSG